MNISIKYTCLFCFAFFGLTAAAQFSVTPEVGGNVTKFHQQTAKMGYKAGVAVTYTFPGRRFALQSGLYYAQRNAGEYTNAYLYMQNQEGYDTFYPLIGPNLGGYNYNNFYGRPDGYEWQSILINKGTMNLNYLQIPILARFNRYVAPDTRFFVALGPYFGYILDGKMEGETALIDKTTGTSYNDFVDNPVEKSGFSRFDWGLSLHAGFEIKQFHFGLQYDISYKRPLSETWRMYNNLIFPEEFYTPTYQTFTISIGYKFNLTK